MKRRHLPFPFCVVRNDKHKKINSLADKTLKSETDTMQSDIFLQTAAENHYSLVLLLVYNLFLSLLSTCFKILHRISSYPEIRILLHHLGAALVEFVPGG